MSTLSTSLSIRLRPGTKAKLESLAKSTRRSRSFLAAEAIEAYVDREAWQLAEIQAGIQDLDEGRSIGHEEVRHWLQSWGKKNEAPGPR